MRAPLRSFLERARRAVRVRWDGARASRRLPVAARDGLVTVGDLGYGGHVIPDGVLDEGSSCYLVGVGEDISFDLGLIARYGVTVHAFDPVPRAAAFVRAAARHEPRLVFHPVAVWERDETLTFHEPVRPGFVSQSAVDLHGTAPSFRAQGRSLTSLMAELGHERIDLLKVSAEGAEFAIVGHALDAGVRPSVLCCEFSLPTDLDRVGRLARRLDGEGYRLVSRTLRPGGWKGTWTRA